MLKNTESATGTNLCKNDMKKCPKDTAKVTNISSKQ